MNKLSWNADEEVSKVLGYNPTCYSFLDMERARFMKRILQICQFHPLVAQKPVAAAKATGGNSNKVQQIPYQSQTGHCSTRRLEPIPSQPGRKPRNSLRRGATTAHRNESEEELPSYGTFKDSLMRGTVLDAKRQRRFVQRGETKSPYVCGTRMRGPIGPEALRKKREVASIESLQHGIQTQRENIKKLTRLLQGMKQDSSPPSRRHRKNTSPISDYGNDDSVSKPGLAATESRRVSFLGTEQSRQKQRSLSISYNEERTTASNGGTRTILKRRAADEYCSDSAGESKRPSGSGEKCGRRVCFSKATVKRRGIS
ncbi:MAG: hypothetical protein P4M11_10155 [Candidatus Pacebacteria bacterium]|nr:hypothetical protein [Candidatus Paceibacterota bacterium]